MKCDIRCRTNVGTLFETLVENGQCDKVIPDATCLAPRFCPTTLLRKVRTSPRRPADGTP